MERRFVLVVRDKTGRKVDMSRCRVDTLGFAGLLGHALQSQDGYHVTILDMSTNPATEYKVSDSGKPILS